MDLRKKEPSGFNPVMPFLCLLLLAVLGVVVKSAIATTSLSYNNNTTTTPIGHVVVIFQENISFDHYFGTYPQTITVNGNVVFQPKANTPSVNGLTNDLLTNNQNSAQPFKITNGTTCDQDHNYKPEQEAYDQGASDEFVEFTNTNSTGCTVPYEVMGYYDGSVVTAMWNYANNYAMSDNFYNTGYGPSTPGALNVICGNTYGVTAVLGNNLSVISSSGVSLSAGDGLIGTAIGDGDPAYDISSSTTSTYAVVTGQNIGNLLTNNSLNGGTPISWGWFQGGFGDVVGTVNGGVTTVVGTAGSHACSGPLTVSVDPDYIQHHNPFQYFASTSNYLHTPPANVAEIGNAGQANHMYDISYFWQALDNHTLPAVSYLKAPGYQDGHAGYSGPLCEQQFLVDTINRIQESPEWANTAIIITYDDSDGWYDHQAPPVVNFSHLSAIDPFTYESNTPPASTLGGYQGRMGYGPRLPCLVISPYSKVNYVDHTLTDQSSVVRFIEDNWNLGRIGGGSFDAVAGTLMNMFDFTDAPHTTRLILNADTGAAAGL